MKFESVMHVAFFTEHMEEMIDFYVNKLGGKVKVLTRYRQYLNRDDRPRQQAIARENPEAIFNVYLEIAPGQFLELFPAQEGQKPHPAFNEQLGYSHFALLTDDIHKAYEEITAQGIQPDTPISKGPSGTWQFWLHDPDGNKFEVMQFTAESYQVTGHLD